MELLIDKKYLVRLESYTKFGRGGYYDPFAVRYVFALPKSAGLPDGYTVYIDAQMVVWEHDEKGRRPFDAKPLYTNELENDRTYRLDRDNAAVYEAMMTENREEGKRYKRYKYTAEELYALYQNVDLTNAELAVAKIDIYLEGRAGNERKMICGNRIDETKYLIGKVQGCWFYCSELDTKRRIGSHGVSIIGKIKPCDKQEVWELIHAAEKQIKQYEHELSCLHSVRDDAERVTWKVQYFLDPKNALSSFSKVPQDKEVMESICAIHNSAKETMRLVDSKLSEETAVLDKIETKLKEQLKKYVYAA